MRRTRICFLLAVVLGLNSYLSCQNVAVKESSLQFPAGYTATEASALQQLQTYPLPRYLPGNHLLRLFNWMDPSYLAGDGQQGVTHNMVCNTAYLLQKELAVNWNYGIVISNAGCAFNGSNGVPLELQLANAYPDISLDVITFWTQGTPSSIGKGGRWPMIFDDKIDAPFALTFVRDGNKNTEIKFNFPDSLIRIDGDVQKFYLSNIIKYLKRPINRINENGEEPPGPYLVDYIKNDLAMIRMKDSMKIDSWMDFASVRKLQMRSAFSSEFMNGLPELKNTMFSFYITEGGPIDRFKWHIMKKCMTPVNGIYYSTPDFYPRWPDNWKTWKGAWHGWKWIEIGRKTEITDGDYLFSPFVAAGWSKRNEENISPGQWLGLLKCLAAVGAEFYYVGYFNLGAPFAQPSGYTWQAVMPAYAQAITSRFEDVLRNGNVLFDAHNKPIISYPTDDDHVLVTARKANNEEKYVICGTYQPFSNDSNDLPSRKNISVNINSHNLLFEIRRQGSVYIYEKTPDNRTIFYQLDSWHQNAHPDHWTKDFYFEAEVADSGISSKNIFTDAAGPQGDYTHFTSYINLAEGISAIYHFSVRDSVNHKRFLWFRYKGKGELSVNMGNLKQSPVYLTLPLPEAKDWHWIELKIPDKYEYYGNNTLQIRAGEGTIQLDKFVVTIVDKQPDYSIF